MKHATFTRFLSLALAIAVMMSWATPIGVYANDEPLTSEGAATEQPAPVEEEVIVPEDVPAASEPSVQEQPAATPAETALPEAEPTAEPVVDASEKPETAAPSATPEATEPTATVEPSAQPTALPEAVEPAATAQPTAQPTVMPETTAPAATAEPSAQPMATPEATEPAATAEPTVEPTEEAAPLPEENMFQSVVDGLIVTAVAAPEANLSGAEMVVKMLGEDAAAGSELQENGIAYDGFLAMDISFVKDGQIIEPEQGTVQVNVQMDASLLPESADVNTLEVQHHAVDAVGNVTIETVADTNNATAGTIEVVENAAMPVVAATFAVDSFSTFTITWGDYFEITVHYVNTNGQELDQVTHTQMSMEDGNTIYFDEIKQDVAGLTYKGAHYDTYNGTPVTHMVASSKNSFLGTSREITFYNGKTVVDTLKHIEHITGTRKQNVYLVYESEQIGPDTGPDQEMGMTKTTVYNPKDDTYDLTLSVSGAVGSTVNKAKVDVLLIVDKSGSMDQKMNGISRMKAVQEAVRKLTENLDQNKDKLDVQYNVVAFSNLQSTKCIVDWTGSADKVNRKMDAVEPGGGTNYQAGFRRGKEQFDKIGARKDAMRVVIFLTDGEPTYRIKDKNNKETQEGAGNNDKGGYNQAAAVEEIKTMSCNSFYAIGAGDDFQNTHSKAYKNLVELAKNCGAGTSAAPSKTAVYSANNTTELEKAFDEIAGDTIFKLCTNVTITDTLSSNVDVVMGADGKPQKLRVKVTDATGKETISSGDKLELPSTTENEAATLTATYDATTKQLKLNFPTEYKLEKGWKYEIIATIAATPEAYKNLNADGTYPNTGDAGTGTYAGQSGLFSNTEAHVDYTYNDKQESTKYPMPVIQLRYGSLNIVKTIDGLTDEQVNALKENLTFTYTKDGETQGTTVNFKEFVYDAETKAYSYQIKNLRPGDVYTITEAGAEVEGYTLTATGDEQSVTIAKDAQVTAEIQNVYTPNLGKLVVRKTLDKVNSSMGKDAVFLFEIKNNKTGEVWTRYITFTAGGTATTVAENLPAGEYTVTELKTAGYKCTTANPVTVTVPAGGQGEATFTNSATNDKTPGDQDFKENAFNWDESTQTWVWVQKK